MQIGVPRETKDKEFRVGMAPGRRAPARARTGHEVLIERGAGVGSGFADEAYAQAGRAARRGDEVLVARPISW